MLVLKNSRDILINFLVIVLSIIAVTTFVVILTGSVFYFYKGADTLIAGIIAFIGAIIGGSITLIGVKMTISETKRKDDVELLETKIFAGEYLIEELTEILSISKRSKKSIADTYKEIEQPSPFETNDVMLKKHTLFCKETDQIYDRIVSTELIKKLGYQIYKEIKVLSDRNMIDFSIDEEAIFYLHYDNEIVDVIERYINLIDNSKTKFEKVHNENLLRYEKLNK